MARGLKFRIYKVDGLYYLSSDNKDADQHRGHRIYAKRLFSHDATQMIFRPSRLIWDLLGISVIHTFYDRVQRVLM